MANIRDVCEKAKVVVAIDFGTTFSGFAFTEIHKTDIRQSYVHIWRDIFGEKASKTPTCLLLDCAQKFKAFGYDAENEYAELDNEEQKNHYYFDKFKMELHHRKEINTYMMLTEKTGKQMPAIDVFHLSLKFLKDKAVPSILDTGLIESEEEIQYVLTVPAIWNPSSKQFMREAATRARLVSPRSQNRLLIALEPEAAAIHCRALPMNKFINSRSEGNASCGDAVAREGSAFMVVDNGGGTVDVAVLMQDPKDSLHEVHKATGGPWGGILFEQEFIKELDGIFGNDTIEQFKRNNPHFWFQLVSKLQSAKHLERYRQGKVTRISMSQPFRRCFMPEYNKLKNVKRIIKSKDLYFSDDEEYICLSSNFVTYLFEKSAVDIIEHMKGLERTLIEKNVPLKVIFLVGGFSECKLLQDQIKACFSAKYRVLIPPKPITAVMEGALMFCLRPDIIHTRICRATYGYSTNRIFDPKIHDPKKKVEYREGVEHCKDLFKRIVKINEPVKYGETRKSYVHPLTADQEQITLTFYVTEMYNAIYIDEPGVKPEGTAVTVDSPDTSKGLDRKIEVAVRFGETEFKVSAIDIETGKNATANITFV